MHRELRLIENSTTIATYYSDHNTNDGETLQEDLVAFMDKIEKKKRGDWNWRVELRDAIDSSWIPLKKLIKDTFVPLEYIQNKPISTEQLMENLKNGKYIIHENDGQYIVCKAKVS